MPNANEPNFRVSYDCYLQTDGSLNAPQMACGERVVAPVFPFPLGVLIVSQKWKATPKKSTVVVNWSILKRSIKYVSFQVKDCKIIQSHVRHILTTAITLNVILKNV